MGDKTVVVESPSKAKTIKSYLGRDFNVVASMGHVRSLPSKPGSVLPNQNFSAIYKDNSEKQVNDLVKKSKGSTEIYLATDPDREGEAISFHVCEILKEHKIISDETRVSRVVFNAITKDTITNALQNPRKIDMDLVKAQQARQSLDYLVGFTLSPLLWQKLPSTKSAGRVQSVLLRLVCEREDEISSFKSQEFWTITAEFIAKNGNFEANLSHLEGKKVDNFFCTDEKTALSLLSELNKRNFSVENITNKPVKRSPKPPFITSTLQQEASSKLRYGTKRTMYIAQKLYEGVQIGSEMIGLITYMRTDGLYIEKSALRDIRNTIKEIFGPDYLHSTIRAYKSKASTAQEAHEAIRPTKIELYPSKIASYLSEEQLNLYTLIWNRTIASQMSDAIFTQTTAVIIACDNYAKFTRTASVIKFQGFYKLDNQLKESELLPELAEGESLETKQITPKQHFTQPPPRYSEAGLVKKMEELGIGRPSTYASIISVIQERGYVSIENRSFIPEMAGRLLNLFLRAFFQKYIEYDFTAQLEEELDSIASGKTGYLDTLQSFWDPFVSKVNEVKKIDRSEILKTIEPELRIHLFPPQSAAEEEIQSDLCPACKTGRLEINLGKFGLFTKCSCCTHTSSAKSGSGANFKELGKTSHSQESIFLKNGPYGQYLQMGERKVPLPKTKETEQISFEIAEKVLELPKPLGNHPETNKEILVGIGNYGPYIKHDGKYVSVKPLSRALAITIDEAIILIQKNSTRKAKSQKRS